MRNMKFDVDKEQNRRVKRDKFLFMVLPNLVNRDKQYGMRMGNEIKELEEIFGDMEKAEIYKVFRDYLKTKKMKLKIIKKQNEYWKHVDKICITEDNLLTIFAVENKFPCMDMYFTENIIGLKKDLRKFFQTYKTES